MLNFMDAHGPYVSPMKFRTMFGNGSADLDRYDGAIAYLDSLVSGIADELRRRGEFERTVIVITADHGELFGEHGIKGHTPSVYRRAVHVPLIISGGRVPRGVRVAAPVSLRDLAATLLDLGGGKDGELPGKALRHAWESGSNSGVSPVVFEAPQGKNVGPEDLTRIGPIMGAADSTWYYIRYADRREEVFRWRTDSLESSNLIETVEGKAAADRLLRLLQSELGEDPSDVTPQTADRR
jgi:arylsulfatase A-like enzyme